MMVPVDFQRRLASLHPTLVVRWEYFTKKKQFILPYEGVPFWRWEEKGNVWYQRMPIACVPKELRKPYMPDADHRPEGCFVVRQPRPSYGDLSTVFDVIDEDGVLLPLDQRVLDAISMRHDQDGEKWKKTIEDADEGVERAKAESKREIMNQLEETALDAFKQATGIRTIAVASNPEAKKSFDTFTVVDRRRFSNGSIGSNNPGTNP